MKKPSIEVWVMVLLMVMVNGVRGRRVDVGGKDGWKQGINYTIWATQENFYAGDWLFFRFDKNAFDVLEVNQTNYENCNSENFIANLTKGGRDVYQLMEARPYYFICSKGYCYGGMKLAIDTRNSPPPAPSPQGNNAASPSYFYAGRLNIMPVLVVAFALFIVSFA